MHPLGQSVLAAAVLTATAAVPAPATQGAGGTEGPGFRETVVDPDQSFRGLDAVDARTAWVSGGSTSGGDGSVWRTLDGGRTWEDVSPPGTAGLSLRDVEARNADTAVVMSVGYGEDSRIWRTRDGGETWTETFRNTDEEAFYNCLDFSRGGRHGLAVSDPPASEGRFRVIATHDFGRSWRVLPSTGMPDSTGEFNFSASGDCLVVDGRHAWFGTGGERARVFHSADHGLTWEATDSTLAAGETAGVFALAFRGARHGVAVGGDFDPAAEEPDGTAYDTGHGWRAGGDLAHLGEDVAWVGRRLLVATGESGPELGTSISTDGGRTWQQVSDTGYHTLDCTRDGSCWAASGNGRVARAG
ncbi:oxidoreductase [Nocardioides sp. GXQ0305]|uniref:oxidoreductase n=1 Tax=Nocardioides sp. GXQ0305 TaxID=3423912 RepID=UPI003D7D0257